MERPMRTVRWDDFEKLSEKVNRKQRAYPESPEENPEF